VPVESACAPFRLTDLGTAFSWLKQHDVKSSRLASVLGISVGHLRLLRYRSQPLYLNTPGESLDAVLSRPTAQMRKQLGVRPQQDVVPRWRKREKKIEDIEAEIDGIWQTYSRSGEYLQALQALRGYEAKRGYPSSALWLRFAARLYQYRAWFCVHSGMTTSAFQNARRAIDLSHLAFKEREDPRDLRRLTEASLIASQACHLAADPGTSLKILDLAAQASARIADPLGSEHYRQRGTAYLQIVPAHDARELRRYFDEATVAMERKQEYSSKGQLMMAGQRHLALLGSPDVELSAAILEQVEKDFAAGSLERAMMMNWTAACALSTDSADLHVYARELLRKVLVQTAGFGHQATRAYLFSITPQIGLERRFWRAWIHRALYENAYRTY
jgi:hypothetical protein